MRWSNGKPKEGAYWVAMAPKVRRRGYTDPIRCYVDPETGEVLENVSWAESLSGDRLIPSRYLVGAKWLPYREPRDPFTKSVRKCG